MDVQLFQQMFNDKYFFCLRKLKYKYPDDYDAFIDNIKEFYFSTIPLTDFNGNNIAIINQKVQVNINSVKLLMLNPTGKYGSKPVEEEIISTAKIESIDYSRDSVRNILKGYAPEDDTETRIYGMKKGFDFISDKSNTITEENIHKLYMMTVGDFLDEENKLVKGQYYRHDSVIIQDLSGQVSHTGMNSSGIPAAMNKLISFINAEDEINDLVKAAIIHFYIAYIHPYFDGNGRMARLIHLWYLVQRGFTNTLFIPFSSYIVKSLNSYYNAYSVIEDNYKLSGIIDVTPFVLYFCENVYGKFSNEEISIDVFDSFRELAKEGRITVKEAELWQFVTATYGKGQFSTKQLEKDFGNAAYATIRSFVIKLEEFGLLESRNFSNRVKYKIK